MKRASAAGYTLLEIAIALTVLGILLSAALVPLQHRFEAEDRRENERALAEATEAIIGYAVANRTQQRTVMDPDGISHRLPSGRPYLPCPDITGDGVENRTAVSLAVGGTITLAATVSIVLIEQGVCQETKGLLPWRTLGLRASADPWGRRLGYRVDPLFSGEVFGFDETFRADIFDPRLPLTMTAVSADLTLAVYQPRANRHESGALVCANFDGGCPRLTVGLPNLLAGILTTVDMTIGARIVPGYAMTLAVAPPQGILDAAAFVVYSHGKNGRGGVVAQSGRCVPFAAPAGANIGERANAYYRAGHPLLSAPFSCTNLTAMTQLSENLFFSAPENLRTNSDDLLAWTSPNSLIGALLRAGALPIPGLGFLPDERR